MGSLIAFLLGVPIFFVLFLGSEKVRRRWGGTWSLVLVLASIYLVGSYAFWAVCSPWTLVAAAAAAATASKLVHGPLWQAWLELLGRHRLPLYLLSVCGMALLAFVAIPITTFLTSPGELGIHLDRMLQVNVRDVMVVVYVSAALYSLAWFAEVRAVLALLATVAFFVCWFYAFAMPFGYPMMSGLAFEKLPLPEWSILLRTLVDLAAVVSIGLGVGWVLRRFGARTLMVSVVIANLSIALAAVISADREQVGVAGGAAGETATAAPLEFSTTQHNTLVIFLDRFMGSYIEGILETDPALARRMSGFVWYPLAVSAGENSIAGIHPMLGGYDYLPSEMNARGEPLRDQSAEAFSILPHNFAGKGYRVNVVSPRGLGFTMRGDCSFLLADNVDCTRIPAEVARRKAVEMGFPLSDLAESDYADLLVLLGSMRVAPYLMKEILHERGGWKPFLDHSAGTTFREWAELNALPELSRFDDGRGSFNFISNILPHEPYYLGRDCMPQPKAPSVTDAELQRSGHKGLFAFQHAVAARCALLSVAGYLDFLKASGAYENTTIAIVSDHGIVGNVEDHSSRAVAGGTTANIYVRLRPLVMVKKAGASGPVQVSEQFMPNAEVPRLLCEDIGGCVNPFLDDRPIAAFGRDDPFRAWLVPWQFSMQEPDAFVVRQTMVLEGKDPFDARGWVVSGESGASR